MLYPVEIPLDGTDDDLSALFSYSPELQQSNLTTLPDFIAHVFNQTLMRDGYFGAWAQVLPQDGKYVLKMFSPHHDLRIYALIVPAWMEAGKTGLSIFRDKGPHDNNQMRFLLPFGLCMSQTRSVQLLHFPPLETFVYLDYLYSPTNRRWENLLGYNDLKAAHFPELETIVDCVPIAAPGDDSKGIEPYNNVFTPYVIAMLKMRLIAAGNSGVPVVAYGGPVRDWLKQAFPDQIPGTLEPLSLIALKLFDNDSTTPVLCANHPSMYLYYTDDNKPEDFEKKKTVMTQDLIAAGWQSKMAFNPGSNPQKVLDAMTAYWTNNPEVLKIMEQEDVQYGYNL